MSIEPGPEPIDTGRRRVYDADAMDAYVARLHARIAALHDQLRQATRTTPEPAPTPRPSAAPPGPPRSLPPPSRTDTVVAVGRQLAAALRGMRRPPVSGLPERPPFGPPSPVVPPPPPPVSDPAVRQPPISPPAGDLGPDDPDAWEEEEEETAMEAPDVFPWLEEPDVPADSTDVEAEFWSRVDHLDVVQDDSYFGELGERPPG